MASDEREVDRHRMDAENHEDEAHEDENGEDEDQEHMDDGADVSSHDDLSSGPGFGDLIFSVLAEDGTASASRVELRAMLTDGRGLRPYLLRYLNLSEQDDEVGGRLFGRHGRRRRPTNRQPAEYPAVPSEAGAELMHRGSFGRTHASWGSNRTKKAAISRRLMMRELGLTSTGTGKSLDPLIAQTLIPSSTADMIVNYDARCYSGQFSDDGNFFFCCAQDFHVRMYDTSNPYLWRYYKTVRYPGGSWTITDATLSPDNKFLAYSSIRSTVCLAPTDPAVDSEPWPLNFSTDHDRFGDFGIWSIRFSGDGREIVAGTQGEAVYVYDLERRQTVVKIDAHDNDVNAVCYGDQSSPHILYSGSDDTTLKVWDRRSLADGREAGVFLGHNEGLTYVDSKGDGRYVLSNGKDQTMKLWDLRRMIDRHRFDEVRPTLETSTDDFDYRRMRYDPADYRPHPHDSSVVTFHGHSVHKTLIRCHFSPPGSTDSRYVYTGSEDGAVYIYNLDATLAGKVDVRRATEASRRRAPRRAHRPRVAYHMFGGGGGRDPGSTCVRDASWHPHAPVIAATSWIGDDMDSGACTLHTWSDGADASEDDDDDDDDDSGLATLVDEHLQRRTCWA